MNRVIAPDGTHGTILKIERRPYRDALLFVEWDDGTVSWSREDLVRPEEG